MCKIVKLQILICIEDCFSWNLMFFGMGLFVGVVLVVFVVKVESYEEVIVIYGILIFGNLVYSDLDFLNLNYVNVDVFKGGVLLMWFQGGFDNLNFFVIKVGWFVVGFSMQFEVLLIGMFDDVDGVYCYICMMMEFLVFKDWVVFNMFDNVIFFDGLLFIVYDVVFSYDLMII